MNFYCLPAINAVCETEKCILSEYGAVEIKLEVYQFHLR